MIIIGERKMEYCYRIILYMVGVCFVMYYLKIKVLRGKKEYFY